MDKYKGLAPYYPNNLRNIIEDDIDSGNITTDTTVLPDNTTIVPNTTEIPITIDVCQRILYLEIDGSQVRIWDLIILIPNVLFLLFLLYKARPAIIKLRHTNSPIFSSFYALVYIEIVFASSLITKQWFSYFPPLVEDLEYTSMYEPVALIYTFLLRMVTIIFVSVHAINHNYQTSQVSLVAIISVLRCIVSMTVNATVTAGDVADKVLWLILRFFLLATELSVVIFGLAFGHLDSQTSIRRVLCVTFFISLVYSSTQGALEFTSTDERFYVHHDDEEFYLFGHGGMLFWFASSVFFCVIYTIICILPCTNLRNRFALPTRKTFYVYCGFLALLNAIQAVGSGMLHYYIEKGLCIVNVTTYIYFTCFAPLVYATFLRDFFKTASPPNILFSYKSQVDDQDDDQVHLPSEVYVPQKYPSSLDPAEDPMTGSFDSTHFDAMSPNPLYDADVPYTGNNAELSINNEYFGRPITSFDREMQNPVA